MSQYWMTVAILLPIIGGILVKVIPFPNQKIMKIYLECVMVESPGGNTGSSSFYAGTFYFFSYRWNVHGIFCADSGSVAAGHAIFL